MLKITAPRAPGRSCPSRGVPCTTLAEQVRQYPLTQLTVHRPFGVVEG